MDSRTPSARRVRWELEDTLLVLKRAQARGRGTRLFQQHYKRYRVLADLRHIDALVDRRYRSGR